MVFKKMENLLVGDEGRIPGTDQHRWRQRLKRCSLSVLKQNLDRAKTMLEKVDSIQGEDESNS